MNDILPDEARNWHRVESVFRKTAELYGYGEVRTPIIEDTSLFVRQIGESSDVVEKEMYSFERHNDALTVRPEGTAGAARAYVEHGMWAKEPISRWYYLGPMFRGERPAKGRYRQFYQAGCELYGDPGPVCDAEMIELVMRVLGELGLKDLSVHVNSLGSGDARERYRAALVEYFLPHVAALSEDSQRRLEKNPLRILDSKDPRDRALVEGAPSIEVALSDEDKEHFAGVRSALDALKVPHTVDPKLVRGLDYYTRTLFEIKADTADLGAQSTVCGGGRYDEMIESLGGQKTPAIGFAMGLERILVAVGALSSKLPDAVTAKAVYIAVVDPAGKKPALELASGLRARGVRCELDTRDAKLKAMLRRADSVGAGLCAIFGSDEVAGGYVTIKDLAARQQAQLPTAEAAAHIAAQSTQSPQNQSAGSPTT